MEAMGLCSKTALESPRLLAFLHLQAAIWANVEGVHLPEAETLAEPAQQRLLQLFLQGNVAKRACTEDTRLIGRAVHSIQSARLYWSTVHYLQVPQHILGLHPVSSHLNACLQLSRPVGWHCPEARACAGHGGVCRYLSHTATGCGLLGADCVRS